MHQHHNGLFIQIFFTVLGGFLAAIAGIIVSLFQARQAKKREDMKILFQVRKNLKKIQYKLIDDYANAVQEVDKTMPLLEEYAVQIQTPKNQEIAQEILSFSNKRPTATNEYDGLINKIDKKISPAARKETEELRKLSKKMRSENKG